MDRKNRFSFFLLVFFLVSVYFFIFSGSGLLEREKLERKFQALKSKIERIEKKNSKLKRRIELYKSGKTTYSDLFRSGYVEKDTSALIFDIKHQSGQIKNVKNSQSSESIYRYLRILWIFISIYAIYRFLKRYRNQREDEEGNSIYG